MKLELIYVFVSIVIIEKIDEQKNILILNDEF